MKFVSGTSHKVNASALPTIAASAISAAAIAFMIINGFMPSFFPCDIRIFYPISSDSASTFAHIRKNINQAGFLPRLLLTFGEKIV